MIIAIIIDIASIFYFKYINFVINTLNQAFSLDFLTLNVVLPLGISFYVIQQIGFIVDSYRGETDHVSMLDYLLFVSFFPQLVQGPILLHNEIIPQFNDKTRYHANYDNLSIGIMLMLGGGVKKVVIADSLAKIVAWGMDENFMLLSSLEIIVVMFSYTFQLYFDFSGYCDIAVGIGKMFNFELPQNFNSPYKAITIGDFWKRWHITLTRFLKKYIYIPLGGSKQGKHLTWFNIMMVFLVSGIWHGANFTFILWGLLHGIVRVFEKIFNINPQKKVAKFVGWCFTFTCVSLLWLLFRSHSVFQWIMMLKSIFFNKAMGLTEAFYIVLEGAGFRLVRRGIIWIVLLFCLMICTLFKNSNEQKLTTSKLSLVVSLALFLIYLFSMGRESTFLYFDF